MKSVILSHFYQITNRKSTRTSPSHFLHQRRMSYAFHEVRITPTSRYKNPDMKCEDLNKNET